MVGVTVFLTAVLAAQSAVASAVIRSRTSYAVKERHNVPRKWKRVARAPSEGIINLNIALKQSQFEELERHLYEVSNPSHERYGNHLSIDEVNSLVKPSTKTLDFAHEWLADNGIDASSLTYSGAKDWIHLTIPVKDAERLLDTEYHVYEHEDGSQLIRTPSWSLPAHLHKHVDAIQPTTSFFRSAPRSSFEKKDAHVAPRHNNVIEGDGFTPAGYSTPKNSTLAAICDVAAVSPECFSVLYGTKGYKPKVPGKNKIGFNNFLGEIPIRPDDALFLLKYRPEAVCSAYQYDMISISNGPIQNTSLTPAQATSGISKEANLDLQAITGISWPTPITAYSTGGSPPFNPSAGTDTNTNEPYGDWLSYILNQTDIPQVISTSYGDEEQSVPEDYAKRVCQGFAQLGARGITIMFSSGDYGVGANDSCISNDGKNTTMFIPDFPTSCPYVTSVGATKFFEPEVAAYRATGIDPIDGKYHGGWSTGAGFSNYFAMPSYQKKVVTQYIKNLNGTFDGLYNKTGRAYPDVSAQGYYFAYAWNQTYGAISGTSASTPLLSGIISLVNDALIAKGKAPLGFLNPWLYEKGYKGFTDILSGSAVGCNTAGFPVTKGWDPATGFGTPVFPQLLKLAGAA
ncbi:tripeptidyl-peptidase 1 precursor protein [Rutstroemia sp. NJR-2017a BBW]|nr:tripeptidyl-peptidase 1 precursor protein [Rutstroemia sp. NJR-2017a BBW]